MYVTVKGRGVGCAHQEARSGGRCFGADGSKTLRDKLAKQEVCCCFFHFFQPLDHSCMHSFTTEMNAFVELLN